MMTDRKELEFLILKALQMGGTVSVQHDDDGYMKTITVTGLKGIGHHPMSPISFAERLREAK
jgi:hypothetical protein